jgi:hypothetical protein
METGVATSLRSRLSRSSSAVRRQGSASERRTYAGLVSTEPPEKRRREPSYKSEASDRIARLELLEGRRLAYDSSMWQAPALTVAAQAFLLQVLTAPGVGWWVASFVAAAGIVASAAASLSLWQQRDREQTYSEAVAALSKELGLGDPRRLALELERRAERGRQWFTTLLGVRAFWIWLGTLAAFMLADFVALVATRS